MSVLIKFIIVDIYSNNNPVFGYKTQ